MTMFTPVRIGRLALPNRIVALPLYTGYACPDGRVSPLMIEHYWKIAKSGASLVVIGNAAVSEDGTTASCNLRVHGDDFIPGLRRLASTIQGEGALACLQLNHGGPFAKTGRPVVPSAVSGATISHDISSLRAFMVSFPVKARFGLTRQLMEMVSYWGHIMTARERNRIIDDFGDAAHRAYQAGFDMVELHGGTGYLLASFLSAYMNHSCKSAAERASFPVEVMKAVRRRLPEGFPVGFRLMVREWVPGGINPEEAIIAAKLLEAAGAAYFSVTAGSYTSIFKPDVLRITAKSAYLAQDAAAVKRAVKAPVVAAGRIFTPKVAMGVIEKGEADLIGLARPLLADNQWVHKARLKEKINVCINCNECLRRVVRDAGVACARWPLVDQERIDLETSLLSMQLSKALVVIASNDDIAPFKANWEERILIEFDLEVRFLFLYDQGRDPAFEKAIGELLERNRAFLARRGIKSDAVKKSVVSNDSGDTVISVAEEGESGVIILAKNPVEPWRNRLATRRKNGVIHYLGSHPNPHHVVVPVDLTAASLLLLRIISQAYYRKPQFDFTFVHVTSDINEKPSSRWRAILEALSWVQNTPLKIITRSAGVSEDLLAEIRAGDYGTVIIGRRRLTAVRRWVVGSVSAAVMEGLGNQNIALVG